MIVQLINFDLEQVGELSVFSSISKEKSYYDIGKFAIHTHPNAPNAHLIKRDMIVIIDDDPYIVKDIEIDTNKMTIRGHELKGIVSRRVCVPPLNLPKRLWKYSQGAWLEITDKAQIKKYISEDILQGYEKPAEVFEGMLWLDLKDMASVYNWESKAKTGEVWLDLERAQTRSKYKNFGYDRITTDGESAILHYISNNITAPEDETRKIPSIVLAENKHSGKIYPWEARFNKLEDVIKKIGEATEVGYYARLDFDNKNIIMGCFMGEDLTDYSTGKIAKISLELGNASNVRYREQGSRFANVAYVGAAGQDEDRLIIAAAPKGESLASGIDRVEIWTEVGNTDDIALIKLAGEKKLFNSRVNQGIVADVTYAGAMRYGRDWGLGDKVIVEFNDKNGTREIKARVTSVTETIETDRPRALSVSFGDSPVTVSTVLNEVSKTNIVR